MQLECFASEDLTLLIANGMLRTSGRAEDGALQTQIQIVSCYPLSCRHGDDEGGLGIGLENAVAAASLVETLERLCRNDGQEPDLQLVTSDRYLGSRSEAEVSRTSNLLEDGEIVAIVVDSDRVGREVENGQIVHAEKRGK